ncbi:MAG: glycosyltransferase family 39 protein [Proteobacteria bacterium]|nr:glycosyltransferase family 39 protein [Pseudomonadota bacterium]
MTESSKTPYVFAIVLFLAVLGLYLPGLQNGLVFDDLRLADGTIFGGYGSLLHFKQRMLSYGSFVWVQELFGDGWWKQRLVNISMHLCVVATLYALLKALFVQTRFPEDIEEQAHFTASRLAALRVAVALFALNPMAVYAVGYLIQRSILMATLFSLLACWAWVRALQSRHLAWFGLALVCYVLAVLSKEHAIMTVAIAVPLYIYIRRPGWKSAAPVVAAITLVLALAVAALLHFYGGLLGKLFDPQSIAFAQQLEALRSGVTQQVYPLSILNQAALFFAYGLLWVLPYVGWMSIDLRPAFPISFAGSWHIAGAIAYVALFATAGWLLLRRRGVLSLAGLLLLFPLLWFTTEFATVWVQDPFVLYRSYLWAAALPGLMAIVLTGFQTRTIYAIGVVMGLLFGALAFERQMTFRDELTAWTDAAEKIDLKAPANAVGRSRPFLNLGTYHVRQGNWDLAARYLTTARSLADKGELGGITLFNTGIVLQRNNKQSQALEAFATAQAMGYNGFALFYHRGESEVATGQLAQALEDFGIALEKATKDRSQNNDTLALMRVRRVEVAIAAQQFDLAISDLQLLLRNNPNDPRLLTGLGMAYIGKGQAQPAIELFNPLLARAPSAPAFYGRAMAYQLLGQRDASLRDINQAIQLEPKNPLYASMRANMTASQK